MILTRNRFSARHNIADLVRFDCRVEVLTHVVVYIRNPCYVVTIPLIYCGPISSTCRWLVRYWIFRVVAKREKFFPKLDILTLIIATPILHIPVELVDLV